MRSNMNYYLASLRFSQMENSVPLRDKLQYLDEYIKTGSFEKAWAAVSSISANGIYLGSSYDLFEKMAVNINKLTEEQRKEYMYGMYYCLNERKKTPFLIGELNKNIIGLESLYVKSFKERDNDLSKFMSSIREETSLSKNISHAIRILNFDKKSLNNYLMTCTDVDYDNSVFLKYLINNIDYKELKEIIFKNNFNLNAIGLINTKTNLGFTKEYFKNLKSPLFNNDHGHDFIVSFVHLTPLVNWSVEDFSDFLVEFKDKIDLNSHFVGTYYDNGFVKRNFNFIKILKNSSYSKYDTLNIINLILENYQISNDMIKSISEYIFNADTIFKYSSHQIYDSFDKLLNNLEIFNNDFIVENILNVGINSYSNNANIITNPILGLLKKFVDKNNTNNFDMWIKYAQSSNMKHDKAITNLFLEYYKDYIPQWTQHNSDKLSKSMREVLEMNGINLPKKVSFLNKWFGKPLSSPEIEKIDITIDKPIISKDIKDVEVISLVDEKLLAQVMDQDIHKYVSAIKLNYEQFHLLLNEQTKSDNSYYMNTSMPKLLNNIIENYIHFVSLDEKEAKENIIIHLKLLHKKTIDVLNSAIKEETENLARNDRVLGRIIKKM